MARRRKLALAVLAAVAIVAAVTDAATRSDRRAPSAAPSAAPVTSVRVAGQAPSTAGLIPSTGIGTPLGDWDLQGSSLPLAVLASQGLATLTRRGAGTVIVYRGDESIRPELRREGWTHIGDPDAWDGYLFDALQASTPTTEKLFEVTAPDGSIHDFVHRLTPDEEANNSFVAVTPNGQWMVSGEWGEMKRLLVFPTPMINPAAPPDARTIPLATSISLDRPVRYVQGCAFISPLRLLCSTDDPGTDLWPTPDQLLQVTLSRPLSGQPMTAQVTSLGQLPLRGACTGTYEVEGIDFQASTGVLRVEVRPPGICGLFMVVYDYSRSS